MMPRVLRLVGQRIKVTLHDEIDLSADLGPGAQAYGVWKENDSEILLCKGQSHYRLRNTFVHENLHAINATAGLDNLLGHEAEEDLVNRMAPVLLSWLRENPRAVAWLQEKE